jgi:5-methylcytosine-specific restriction protein A
MLFYLELILMPLRPKKPCAHPGCPNLTLGKYCDKHKKNSHKYDEFRGTAAQRGYDSRWRKARLLFLREHPFCVYCERKGKLIPAQIVDHIVPHKGDFSLFWDEKNWQPLCASCHSRKTVEEDGGFGNAIKGVIKHG